MTAVGRSNWMGGFDAAFNLIDNSLEQIATNGTHDCMVENVALLFFSDGDMNLPIGVTNRQVTEFVTDRIESAESLNSEGPRATRKYNVMSYWWNLEAAHRGCGSFQCNRGIPDFIFYPNGH